MTDTGKADQNKALLQLRCEWDIGQDDLVFTSLAKAREWTRKHLEYAGIGESLEECVAEGLVSFRQVKVL